LEACRRCKSIRKSFKHSTGTLYFRSADEYLVRNEMIRFLPSGEWLSALKSNHSDRGCFFIHRAIPQIDRGKLCQPAAARAHLSGQFGRVSPVSCDRRVHAPQKTSARSMATTFFRLCASLALKELFRKTECALSIGAVENLDQGQESESTCGGSRDRWSVLIAVRNE